MKGKYVYIVVAVWPTQWGSVIGKIVSVHDEKKDADAFVDKKKKQPLAAEYDVIKKRIK